MFAKFRTFFIDFNEQTMQIVLFRLIATSQKLKKYQKLDLKKSSQVLKIEFEVCFDVKFKFLILTSSSNSSRNLRFEI